MTDEEWLAKWSVVRDRGMARQIALIAAFGFAFGIVLWLASEGYRFVAGEYLIDYWMFTSPYAAIWWAIFWAINERIGWWLNERKFSRLEKGRAGIEP